MPIIRYERGTAIPRPQQVLHDLSGYAQATRAMCSALGDYWMQLYRDTEVLAQTGAAMAASLSTEFSRVLDIVLSSNVLDIPTGDYRDFHLFSVSEGSLRAVYAENGELDYYSAQVPDLKEAAYLTTTLFESPVILEAGVHFEITAPGEIKFYVDLFHDPGIDDYALTFQAREREMLFWATDCALVSSLIYEKYGVFLYRESEDSEAYRWIVQALMRFFTGPKTNRNLGEVLNILYGVPYTRWDDEMVLDIYPVDAFLERMFNADEAPYLCVETDRGSYYTYAFAELLVNVGDILPRLTLISSLCSVDDYISRPGWWEETKFPERLVSSALSVERQHELMDKVLKYNTLYIRIGTSFETYAAYLRQLSTLLSVIQGGVPVYLYPVVLSSFVAAFVDTAKSDDTLCESLLRCAAESVYSWEGNLYDGTWHYYPEPNNTHGQTSVFVMPTYEGRWLFGGEDREGRLNMDRHDRLLVSGNKYDGAWSYIFVPGLDHDARKDSISLGSAALSLEDSFHLEDELAVNVRQV